mgnify:CR=1 FL=1
MRREFNDLEIFAGAFVAFLGFWAFVCLSSFSRNSSEAFYELSL